MFTKNIIWLIHKLKCVTINPLFISSLHGNVSKKKKNYEGFPPLPFFWLPPQILSNFFTWPYQHLFWNPLISRFVRTSTLWKPRPLKKWVLQIVSTESLTQVYTTKVFFFQARNVALQTFELHVLIDWQILHTCDKLLSRNHYCLHVLTCLKIQKESYYESCKY